MSTSQRSNSTFIIAVVVLSAIVGIAVWVGLTGDEESTDEAAPPNTSLEQTPRSNDSPRTSGAPSATCKRGAGAAEANDGVGMCIYGAPFDDPNFFPIAVYSASGDEAQILADEGFNLVLTGASPPDSLPSWGGPQTPAEVQAFADNDIHVVAAFDMAEPLQAKANNPYLIGFGSTDEPIKQFGLEPEEVFAQFDSATSVEGFEDHLGFVTFAGHTFFYEPRGTSPDVMEDTKEVAADARTDLIAFDIYPLSYCSESGFMNIFEECNIGVLGHTVDHFQSYSNDEIPVFSWTDVRYTFGQQFPGESKEHLIDAMVWLPINHGSQGVAWFTIEPGGQVADYLRNPVVSDKVREINSFVTSLAPVLNSPGRDTATATSDEDEIRMDLGGRVHDGKTYIFAVADSSSLGDGPSSTATFEVEEIESGTVTELRSGDTQTLVDGAFTDEFDPYEVRIYEIKAS